MSRLNSYRLKLTRSRSASLIFSSGCSSRKAMCAAWFTTLFWLGWFFLPGVIPSCEAVGLYAQSWCNMISISCLINSSACKKWKCVKTHCRIASSILANWDFICRSKGVCFFFTEIPLFDANSVDPDQLLQFATSAMGLHCLPKSFL